MLQNHAMYYIYFQICSISIHLQHSAINLDCSKELNYVKDLNPVKKRLVLDRICQFNNETGGETTICDSHYSALITNFMRHAKCLSEYHLESERRISGKTYDAAEEISPSLSNHVHVNTGYIMPKGGLICQKCRHEITDSLPPLAQKKKVEEVPENSQSSGSEPLSDKNDESFNIPSQDAQVDRVEGLNKMLEYNNMKPRFAFRMGGEDKNKPFASYTQPNQCIQMELLLASFQAVLNTVQSNKADHAMIWGKVVESHKMDERLGYVDKLILDMIQVYNKCSTDRQRIQVSL